MLQRHKNYEPNTFLWADKKIMIAGEVVIHNSVQTRTLWQIFKKKWYANAFDNYGWQAAILWREGSAFVPDLGPTCFLWPLNQGETLDRQRCQNHVWLFFEIKSTDKSGKTRTHSVVCWPSTTSEWICGLGHSTVDTSAPWTRMLDIQLNHKSSDTPELIWNWEIDTRKP